jgi:hypothetical protein
VAPIGLSKAEIRRLVLGKLRVVYRDWGMDETPFARAGAPRRSRRDDPRAFVVALVAALLGGLSEAMERNTRALAAALPGVSAAARARGGSRRTRGGRTTRGRP